MRRLLIPIFVVAFALGTVAAVIVVRQHAAPAAQESPVATTPDKDDDSDKDSSPRWPDDAGTPEQVLYAQEDLMRRAVEALKPRSPGKANLYMIGFAGDGEEDVFRNEVEFAERLMAHRFDAEGHTLLLVNNPATLKTHPLANLSNLQAAVDAIDNLMAPDEDILLLLLSSHGSREHELYVSMDPLPLDQIAPDDLADVFASTHLRYKVIVISACYSGGFIDALKDGRTMIVTAARADRASFGCSADSDITDFGRAFFVEGLNHNDSFQAAFAEASRTIEARETRDDEEHSYPQFVTSPLIEAALKRWRDGIRLGAPVPFGLPTPPRKTDKEALTAAVLDLR
ncbi:MAG TPA: C13 family peptidase [Rudaea sp.]|nr:C13 family peptidase [Rudaea sp.]